MTKDLSPYLYGLTPDPEGVASARAYADFSRPTPLQRLEEFTMSLALFYKDHAGPDLPAEVGEAVRVFLFAASGFLAILEDVQGGQGSQPAADWKALGFASMWARSERDREGAALTAEEKEDLHRAANSGSLRLLPLWVGQLRAAGKGREAARFATWAALTRLLEAAPLLEDGDTEAELAALLEALAHPEDLPGQQKPAAPEA